MTEHDLQHRTAALPRPRTAGDDDVPAAEAPHFPWPEPWRHSRGARPRTEFWDVATASWRSRGPRGD